MLVPLIDLKAFPPPIITGKHNNPTMAPVTDPFPIPGLESYILGESTLFDWLQKRCQSYLSVSIGFQNRTLLPASNKPE